MIASAFPSGQQDSRGCPGSGGPPQSKAGQLYPIDAQDAAPADGHRNIALLVGPVGMTLVGRQVRRQSVRAADGRPEQAAAAPAARRRDASTSRCARSRWSAARRGRHAPSDATVNILRSGHGDDDLLGAARPFRRLANSFTIDTIDTIYYGYLNIMFYCKKKA
jgi:hypothetical protein